MRNPAPYLALAILLLVYVAAAPHFCTVHADWDATVRTDHPLFQPWAAVSNQFGGPFKWWTEMFQPPQTGGELPSQWLPSAWTVPTDTTLQAARTLGGPPNPQPSRGPLG